MRCLRDYTALLSFFATVLAQATVSCHREYAIFQLNKISSYLKGSVFEGADTQTANSA